MGRNFVLVLIINFCCFVLCSTSTSSTTGSVAIVGAGAGGSCSAYFLRKQFPNISITIFEKNDYVGGRVLSTQFAGTRVELGATTIHTLNKYMVDFGLQFNVSKQEKKGGGGGYNRVAIWDGKRIVWEEGYSSFTTTLSFAWRYGLLCPYWVKQKTTEWTDKWMNIYSDDKPFHSIQEYLERYSMNEGLNITFSAALYELGCTLFVDELANGISRGIYNQNASILSSIAGFVSLSGMDSKETFRFVDNSLIFKNLIESSANTLKLNSHVNSIKLNIEVTTEDLDGSINVDDDYANEEMDVDDDSSYVLSKTSSTSYTVRWTTQNGEHHQQEFDAIIIATPLELSGNMVIDGIPPPPLPSRPFRLVHVTLCHGVVDHSFFGVDPSSIKLILTTSDASKWTQFSVIKRFSDGSVLVKFFSIQEIPEEELNKIFLHKYETLRHPIYSYPMLTPGFHFPPIQISTNLFYVNAFESVLSVMEGSALSARNVVKLLEESWEGGGGQT